MATKFEKIATQAYLSSLPKTTVEGVRSFFLAVERDGAQSMLMDMDVSTLQSLITADQGSPKQPQKQPQKKVMTHRATPEEMSFRKSRILALLQKSGPLGVTKIQKELRTTYPQTKSTLDQLIRGELIVMNKAKHAMDTTYAFNRDMGEPNSEEQEGIRAFAQESASA